MVVFLVVSREAGGNLVICNSGVKEAQEAWARGALRVWFLCSGRVCRVALFSGMEFVGTILEPD